MRAKRTVAVANAKHPANPLARHLVVSQIKSAKKQQNNF